MMGKNWISISYAQIRLRTCLTILGFSKSYVKWKICIFKLKTNSKSDKEKHTLDLDVLESNPHGEDEERSCKSLINPKFFVRWLAN